MTITLRGVEVLARELGWRYSGASHPTLAGADFHLRPGQACLITGRSGSGKSTLAWLVAGLLEPGEDGEVAGELTIGQRPWWDQDTPVGVVLQQPDDQTIMHTVGDDIAFGLENFAIPPEDMTGRIHSALDAVSLQLPLSHPTAELSGGQRQRLALAGALAMEPGLLVLDEPLQALDAEGREQVVSSIRALQESTSLTLIIIDHQPEPWRDMVDTVVVVDQGVVSQSSVDEAEVQWRPELPPHSAPVGHSPGESPLVLESTRLVVGRGGRAVSGPHSLQVAAGEILALVGPNGSGKTTLCQTLAGLIAPISGEVTNPVAPHTWSAEELSREIAFVPQNPQHHQVGSTVAADIDVSRNRTSEEETTDGSATELLGQWGLAELADRHPASLSGGEARRLALAGALAQRSRVLILDEPSQSLDGPALRELVTRLRDTAETGVAIVLASHDERFIEALGARRCVVQAQTRTPTPPIASAAPRWMREANPLALLAAAGAIGVGLLVSLDWVSALIAWSATLILLAGAGAVSRRSLLRAAPIALAALFAGITIALYGESSGEVLFEWAIVRISEGSIDLAFATVLRILAIATPAVLLFQGVEPTRLADGLAQRLHLPERFVIGALSGLRLVQLLGADYQQIQATRRSRGLASRKGLRRIFSDSFALLVVALARAQTLSRAMESRGFGRAMTRSHYRQSLWGRGDTLIVVIGVGIVALALAVAVWTGAFRGVFL